MNCGRTPAPLTPAAQAKLTQRTNVLVQWVWALRERRDEETRGIVHPPPTPEQMVEAGVVVDRFKRWLAGDDNAGRFE